MGFLSHYKYLIVIVLGVLIVGFVDENSLRQHFQNKLKIGDLQAEIERYNTQHAKDSKRLREIKSNPKAVEKVARERYFMKADDEDIFVLSTDLEKQEGQP